MKTDNENLNYWKYVDELFDEFGNRKRAYEIVRYEKYADKKWHEEKRYNTFQITQKHFCHVMATE